MILQLANILFIAIAIWHFRPKKSMKSLYFSGILFRLGCGFTVGWFYMIYLGSGDTLAYHESATSLCSFAKDSFADYLDYLFTAHYGLGYGEARTEIFVKFLSLLYLLTDNSYWLASAYCSLFSFMGAWYLVRKLKQHCTTWLIPAAIAFLYFPTSTLWSSGVLKDSLAIGAILFLAGICVEYHLKNNLRIPQAIGTIGALLLLFYLKFYLVAVVGLVMGLMAWNIALDKLALNHYTKGALYAVGLLIIGYSMSYINLNLHIDYLPEAIYKNYELILTKSSYKEALIFPNLQPTYISLISHIPESLASGLFRPFIWEIKPALLPSALENLVIFILTLLNFYYYKYFQTNKLTWLCLLYIIVLATVLPLVAPNFGTLMRYKAAFMPFYIFIIIIIPYQRLLQKR